MYIFSLQNAASPEFLFKYTHIVSCDPVVVQGDRAYITLRGGNSCHSVNNTLEIVDISNPMDPVLLQSYEMQSPYGLGISGDVLFLCEGTNGLKVFTVNQVDGTIQPAQAYTTFHAYDVIVKQNSAIVTGLDGIFQFSFNSDASDIELVSTIPVDRVAL
jgi:hypothetical protein